MGVGKIITGVVVVFAMIFTLLTGSAFATEDWTSWGGYMVQEGSGDGAFTGMVSDYGGSGLLVSGVAPSLSSSELVHITQEPADVMVSYPAEARFHVEVDHPENVASYEWLISDGDNYIVAEGTSQGD